MNTYIPQTTLDEIRDYLRGGGDLQTAADEIGIASDVLERLLHQPQWKRVPDDDDSIDLWRGEDQL